jgi:hypothetical protein
MTDLSMAIADNQLLNSIRKKYPENAGYQKEVPKFIPRILPH